MGQFGLPKEDLLRKSWEFLRVYRQGRRLKGRGFSVIMMAGNQVGSRLGISVHRSIRGAVRRNRIKRMVREVFRLHRDIFPPASDIVVTIAPGFHLTSTLAIHTAMAALLAPEKAVRA